MYIEEKDLLERLGLKRKSKMYYETLAVMNEWEERFPPEKYIVIFEIDVFFTDMVTALLECQGGDTARTAKGMIIHFDACHQLIPIGRRGNQWYYVSCDVREKRK